MLSKKNRLTDNSDFQRVSRTGKFSSLGSVSLKYAPNKLSMSRIGFSVGLKFSKKATERNKAKRLLREAARRHATELVNGYDIIIFFKHRPAKFDLGMLTGDIGRLLEKNKLLKKTRAADG